jgi:hypothetical protein
VSLEYRELNRASLKPSQLTWSSHIHDLREKVLEREMVLDQLEMAETEYINSFHLVRTASNGQRLEGIWEGEVNHIVRSW